VAEEMKLRAVVEEAVQRRSQVGNRIRVEEIACIPVPAHLLGGEYMVTLKPVEQDPEPCPFCGGQGMKVGDRFSGYCVQCADCNATGPSRGKESEATEAWNRRQGKDGVFWEIKFEAEARHCSSTREGGSDPHKASVMLRATGDDAIVLARRVRSGLHYRVTLESVPFVPEEE